MTTLIIDNYDSFAWNLFQLFGALGGEPRVVRNDAVTLADVRRIAPWRIVLSPGPGRPDDPARVGVCRAILDADLDIPVLGVCLGHQAIVCAAGGRVVSAERPMHGKTSLVEHHGDGIFAGLPRPFEAMRYHSLTADPASLPPCLTVTAWCKDGTVMAVRHQRRPLFGVQFHPESIGTAWGPTLCQSFLRGDFA
ncbi:MAG: aminodeoxychorismate/anthranilate synthase component II [Labilithrix sp.]|nr:aminodeoxychorismate/anthranilate synthase component II [Labilithrix sp.]MBX3218229.1 aminodeoxychorismate/anthranilate synthase component II [Labilithrix sp.]